MEPVRVIAGPVSVLDRADVDTDQIIPKQFLKRVERTGFGEFLFYDWAQEPGWDLPPNPILAAGPNFGCGSSREHAAWALRDYGFRAVVAPGFGDIFRQNCALNGVAPIVLAEAEVAALFALAQVQVLAVTIDVAQGVLAAGPQAFRFQLTPRQRLLLTQDVDWIAATLAQRERIAAFEAARLARQPWLDRMFPR